MAIPCFPSCRTNLRGIYTEKNRPWVAREMVGRRPSLLERCLSPHEKRSWRFSGTVVFKRWGARYSNEPSKNRELHLTLIAPLRMDVDVDRFQERELYGVSTSGERSKRYAVFLADSRLQPASTAVDYCRRQGTGAVTHVHTA